jgi:PAS domain S-box-containing protein
LLNPIPYLATLSAAIFCVLGGYTLNTHRSARVNQVFVLLCACFAGWNVTLVFIATVPTIEQVWFWFRASALAWTLAPTLLLHFFILLTTPNAFSGKRWILPTCYAISVIFLVRALTSTVFAVDFTRTPWGWDEVVRPNAWGWAYIGYYSVSAVVGLWLVHRWGSKASSGRVRRRAKIILFTAIPTLTLVSVSNIVLRLMDLHLTPGLAPIMLTIWGLGIGYTIVKHDLLDVDPAAAAVATLATMVDALLLISPEGRVLADNPAAARLFDRDLLKGADVAELFPNEPLFADGELARRLADGPILSAELTHEVPGGQNLALSLAASRVHDAFGDAVGTVVILRDVSEVKRLEATLLQTAKMDAIGQLAGGVAHDFNNLLAVMLAEAQLIRMVADKGSPQRESAQAIEQAAHRAAELTRQLLGLARRGKQQHVRVDLRDAIHEATRMLQRTLRKRVSIALELNAAHSTVVGDPNQLQQVLLNLAINARDAMPDGGKLTFRTQDVRFGDQPGEQPGALEPGAYVELLVEDTGQGIAPADLPRIFEPFYTTKAEGQGTGMGLATVYGIVTNHGGSISAQSSPRGTTFRLFLQAAEVDEVRESQHPSSGKIRRLTGRGRVLVVDDEELVLGASKATLEALGYEVLAATSSADAEGLLAAAEGGVDLVLLDVMMPEVDGRECLRRLRAIDPDLKALVVSGYAREGEVQQMLDSGALGFLQKPFSVAALGRAVRAAMSGQRVTSP